MSSDLIFDPDARMISGFSSFVGILGREPLSFENILARLNRLCDGNQDIFDDGNFDKSSFNITGTYKGEYFDLYDYKGDEEIHIGGGKNLDYKGLHSALKALINQTEPKPFKCRCSYSGQKYSYP